MSALSRRALTGTTAAAAVTAATATRADAATTWTPVAYSKTPIPGARARLIASRFTGGWTPSLQREITLAGGIDKWLDLQLAPGPVPDLYFTTSTAYWPSNTLTPQLLWRRHRAGTEQLWETGANYERWSMLRRMYGSHHVQEQLAAFWEHHFNVPATGEAQAPFRPAYGKVIRAKALGSFADLLKTVTTHPAMGCYLDNATSTKAAPNENLGRELLELHTVGREAGYTETDVKNSARILTGYRVDIWKTWNATYDPESHWVGPVKVLGFSDRNAAKDGRAVTLRYLDYLAHHPATARRIARKLAVRFVSDTPSATLVSQLAKVYLAHGTRIVPVLRALVASPEFLASAGRKVRTADEDVVATYRALGARSRAPLSDQSAANAMLWQSGSIGLLPYSWPRPDGRPDTGEDWSSVSRMLASFQVHYCLSGGWWPSKDITYRTPKSWLPQPSIRMDYFVDHLARSLLGRGSTAALLKACCEATDTARTETITVDHKIIKWSMARLLTTFLDTPQHLGR
jgi:hypothetical protein